MEELCCMTCGAHPPETESAYTLIGGKAGWRLTRTKRDDGSVLTQWRCADCWNAFKKAAPPAAPAPARTAGLSSPPAALKRR
jgi:hypothetical protein